MSTFNEVDVIVQPVTLRFSLYEDEITYHFASHPKQQLDNMERLLGVDVDQCTFITSNVGFLPVASVTLIRGDKNILVDPGNHHVGFYGLLADALKQRGLTYADIDTIVVTHWHHDHFSNLSCFDGQELVIGEGELDFGRSMYGQKEVDARIYKMSRISEVSHNKPFEIAKGVTALMTPGHTPNSISVLVENGEERIGIVGDLAMTREDFHEQIFSHWYTDEQVELSRDSLRRLAGYEPTRIIPGHDRSFKVESY